MVTYEAHILLLSNQNQNKSYSVVSKGSEARYRMTDFPTLPTCASVEFKKQATELVQADVHYTYLCSTGTVQYRYET
jgi:hypothetical protein